MKMLLYAHYNSDPYFNMGFDEWMLQKVINNNSLVCVRLYSWSIGTITFGYNQQKQKAYDNAKVGETPVIKRVTGGRGLFHDESELTYSIAISSDLIAEKVLGETIAEASSDIAKILIQFLDKLHIKSDYVRQSHKVEQDRNFFQKAPCFASFSKNEIVANEKKIIASAQRRVLGALLQHGSIKINGFKHHEALPIDSVKYMESKEIKDLSQDDFEKSLLLFTQSFSKAFSASVQECELTEFESEELEKRINLVKNNSEEKRDFIKQTE